MSTRQKPRGLPGRGEPGVTGYLTTRPRPAVSLSWDAGLHSTAPARAGGQETLRPVKGSSR